jgi:hypothetical protein
MRMVNRKPQSQSVYVWRTIERPPLGRVGKQCVYCNNSLISGNPVHPITNQFLLSAQIGGYRKPLEQMTADDWEPFRRRAKKNNATEAGGERPEPETLEDAIDFFYNVQCNAYNGLCTRCGWWLDVVSHHFGASMTRTVAAALRDFDLTNSDLTIPEICSHLDRTYSDVYSLPPRKFEEVVAHIYRSIGWEVILTKQSRDGGIDLYCISNKSGEVCIVECKRYAKSRKVGIAAVDRLLGVAFRSGARHAHLVTSSSFTKPASQASDSIVRREEIEMDLIDAHELSRMIGIYADKSLTVKDIKAIFASRNGL